MTQNPTPAHIARKILASAGLTTARDFAILGSDATPSTGFRSRRTITSDDLAAFIDIGFDTSDQIKELWVAGVSPEDVSEYQKLGIDSVDGIKRASAAGVTPKVAKDFQEKGVYDLNDMLAMKKSKIGASTLKAYHRLEDFTGEDAERLKNAGASAALVNAAVSTGIKTVDAVISVAKAGVKGNDILVVSLGYTVEEAIILIKSFGGFNVGDAYKNISAWHELGVKGYEANFTLVLYAPRGVPDAIVARMRQAFVDALNAADVTDRLRAGDQLVVGSTPAQAAAQLAADAAKWGAVVRRIGLGLD